MGFTESCYELFLNPLNNIHSIRLRGVFRHCDQFRFVYRWIAMVIAARTLTMACVFTNQFRNSNVDLGD